MATLKGIKRAARSESLSGKMMVDTVRGVLRVRKWPRKRGTPKSARQRWWNDWFRQANLLAKYVDAATMRKAIELTANTGMYPRDIILKAMRGRLYVWRDQTGKVWYPMAGIQDISESLDVLAQTIGSVLVRATDRWRPADPGNLEDVLTYKGDEAAPVWQAPSAGGLATTQLAGTPLAVDNTKNVYSFDVSSFAAVEFTLDAINLAASDGMYFRYSTDGGTVFHSGASDYRTIYVAPGSDNNAAQSAQGFFDVTTSADQWGSARLENLRVGRVIMRGFIGASGSAKFLGGIAAFDGPVTDIQILTGSGNNFASGTIRATGFLA